MSLLSDSFFLLNEAERQLQHIEEYYLESLHERHISLILRLKIKHFLEDVRSSLDYAAFQIFTSICAPDVTTNLEHLERMVQFPFKESEKKFNQYVKNAFPNLDSKYPNIISTFKKLQVFSNSDNNEWFYHLNDLCNKNKHRYLTPQTKKVEQIIRTLDQSGRTLSSFYHGAIVMNGCVGGTVDGMPWDEKTQMPIPVPGRGVEVQTWIGVLFTELNLPVLPTLRDILSSANLTIRDLENIIL